MDYGLTCPTCGKRYGSDFPGQTCGSCGSILEVVYDWSASDGFDGMSTSFWDLEPALPSGKYHHYEVGGTKLMRASARPNLFMKLEQQNPTRSFKDRGSVIEIAKALEYGYSDIVCASTGNMAYSLAYYSRLAGLRAHIFMSRKANADKLRMIKSLGSATMHMVDGDFTAAEESAKRYAAGHRAFLTGDYCYRKEGQKTMAYEMLNQLPNATHIIVPVGNATLISGIYKGLCELKMLGRVRALPKIVAVQASGSDSLVTAFKSGAADVGYVRPRTRADAIAVGLPKFGAQALEAIRRTNGAAVAVTDPEMRAQQREFYNEYGLVAELGGVASLAAVKKMRLSRSDRAVAVISGANI